MTFGQWLLWFVRTPQRFLTCVAVAVTIIGLRNPQAVEGAVYNLLAGLGRAVSPFIEPALTWALVITGFGVLLRWAWGGKGGR